MAASQIAAGRAFLQLFVDDTEFRKGLAGAQKRLNAFAQSVAGIGAAIGAAGAAIAAPFVASLKVFSDTGSALADMEARTGLTARSLSVLKYAAEQSGTSLEAVEKAAREMQSKGIDPNLIFEYARRIKGIEDPTKRAQAAFDVFSKRAGSAILPILGQLDDFAEKAEKLGLVWDEEMVQNADRFGDAMDTLKSQLYSIGINIGNAVAPALSKLLEMISGILPTVIDWIKQNKELVAVVGILGAALVAIGATLVTVGGGLALIVPLFAAIVSPAGLAAIAITSIGTAMAFIVAQIPAFEAAMQAIINKIDLVLKGFRDFINTMSIIQRFGDQLKSVTGAGSSTTTRNTPRPPQNTLTLSADDRAELDALRFLSPSVLGLLPGLLRGRLSLPSGPQPGANVGIVPGAFGPLANPAQFAAENAVLFANLQKEVEEAIANISRDTRGGFGGKFAEQIGGVSAADAREERMLRLEDRQTSALEKIEQYLRAGRPLLIGAS